MKILILPTSYPDDNNRIRNSFILEQAKALFQQGHDIRILHANKMPSSQILKPYNNTIKKYNEGYAIRYCRLVKTFVEERFGTLNKLLFMTAMESLFAFATKDGWKPDVIYAHFSCWAGYAAVKLGCQHSIPVVVMEHYSGYMSNVVPKHLVDGLSYVLSEADAFICVSNKLKERILQLTGSTKHIYVIPNMINSIFKYTERSISEPFIFATLCNLNSRKRVNLLVEAFCKAFEKSDKVLLLIGGDGPEKNSIESLIKTNEREDQIKLLGPLDRDKVLALYQKANCFALASAHETFGIVWREAMATGLPVITSNHEGWSKNDWSDDFGIMVPIDDFETLTESFKTMKKNYYSFDSKKIASYINEHYSEAAVVEQIEKVLYQFI